MSSEFSPFSRLPPEIRHKIWGIALEQEWSFTQPRRVKRGIKFFGKAHRAVGQACHEARTLMQLRRTGVDSMKWIDFSHHLFFFRDARYELSLLRRGLNRYQLLETMQHLVIFPRNADNLWDTLEHIKSCCTSLRNLIIIGPWFDPGPLLKAGRHDLLSLAPNAPGEEWDSSIDELISYVDVNPLVEAIKKTDAADRTRQLEANLEEAMQHMPDILDEADIMHTACGFTQRRIQRIGQIALEFPSGPPNLYYCTKNELCPLTAVVLNDGTTIPEREQS